MVPSANTQWILVVNRGDFYICHPELDSGSSGEQSNMKLGGVPFKNSDTCEGVAYSDPKAGVDMSIIKITGRYPETGWAVNHKVHEIALVLKGMGNLAIKNREITELSEGDVVLVDPGERFAWSGNLTIAMACNPPFDPEQYSVEEDLYEQ